MATRPSLRRLRALAVRVGPPQAAAGLALAAGVTALLVSLTVFPYHSLNHDEGVYLQQAAMLLEGKLAVRPPVPEAVRPWFFVADGGRLYPKYAPVTAAVFAVGKLLGGFRLALGGVAAACVWLTYATTTELFDRRTGLLAAALLAVAPLFVVQSAVFLPYLPTTALNLLFAWAYLRADRTGSRAWAALAGGAVGLAFFARPYTAVLFAAPFLLHACWTLVDRRDRATLVRQATTAALGLGGVALALGYNAVVTGDPLLFPYAAFAPLDGLGFGYHRILGYDRVYSVPLALEANARLLGRYVLRWAPLGPAGVGLFALGLWALGRDGFGPRRLAVVGVAPAVVVGELYFWGTLNTLGELGRVGDGLAYFLGPYYHVDLLIPTAVFGAVGGRWLWGRLRGVVGADRRRGLALAAALLAVGGAVAGGTVAGPLAVNGEVTDRYAQAYEPLEDDRAEGALVLMPDPLGDWLNHPFQAARNDPGLDEGTVYALEERLFAVIDAIDRPRVYRYVYRGAWNPTAGPAVTPHLQRVRVAEGDRVRVRLEAGVPAAARSVSLRVKGARSGSVAERGLSLDEAGGQVPLTLAVTGDRVRVSSPALSEPATVLVGDRDEVRVTVFVDTGTAGSFSYRAYLPVETRGTVRAVTPALEVCRYPRRCGGEAAFVPGAHRPGVDIEARVLGGDS